MSWNNFGARARPGPCRRLFEQQDVNEQQHCVNDGDPEQCCHGAHGRRALLEPDDLAQEDIDDQQRQHAIAEGPENTGQGAALAVGAVDSLARDHDKHLEAEYQANAPR